MLFRRMLAESIDTSASVATATPGSDGTVIQQLSRSHPGLPTREEIWRQRAGLDSAGLQPAGFGILSKRTLIPPIQVQDGTSANWAKQSFEDSCIAKLELGNERPPT